MRNKNYSTVSMRPLSSCTVNVDNVPVNSESTQTPLLFVVFSCMIRLIFVPKFKPVEDNNVLPGSGLGRCIATFFSIVMSLCLQC